MTSGLAFFIGEKMKMICPLFWRISAADQAKLMDYQFNTYKYHLQIPPETSFKIDTELESPEEIARLMRQKPNPKRMRNL